MTQLGDMVAVAGAQGTGKSTFAAALFASLKALNPGENIGYVDEIARRFVPHLGTERGQRLIFAAQMLAETEARIRNTLTVGDRSLLDNIAYALKLDEELSWLWTPSASALASTLAWEYRLIIFLRPEAPIADDGVRDTSPESQTVIDSYLARLFAPFGRLVCSPSAGLALEAKVAWALDQLAERWPECGLRLS